MRFLACIITALLLWPFPAIVVSSETVDFSRDIRPLLSDRCFVCHGPDENTRQADLRLDQRDAVLERAIQPGDVSASELMKRVTSDDPELVMPPPDSNRMPISKAEAGLLQRWIEQGAEWHEHWAFVPPERAEIPTIRGTDWMANPIDHFLLSAFEATGSRPSVPADRRTLMRRLNFDVLGLPPTADEIRDAMSTTQVWDRYYEARVDDLLRSPAFGERLAAYWLDVVRYADSCGIHGDQVWTMFPYRDYVIDAFNDNMPFDRFLREQLAGDLLPDATEKQKIASAFNRMHMITAEGGAQNKEYLAIYAADRVRNTSAALMGVTMGCAQCHDHKFDPFTTKEFYEFASFFADLKETGVYGGNNWYPQMIVASDEEKAELRRREEEAAEYEKKYQVVNNEVERLKAALATANELVADFEPIDDPVEKDAPVKKGNVKADSDAESAALGSTVEPDPSMELKRAQETADKYAADLRRAEEVRKAAESERKRANKRRDEYRKSLPSVIVSESVEPREMRVLPRGNWLDDSGPVVQPRVPSFLLSMRDVNGFAARDAKGDRRLTRVDLANWMTHRNHPLVARVFVNRLWKLFFGRGIVSTLDDFGFQGDSPTHPNLLDWLAIEFIESGWDVKHMIRLMVTSRAYQQSSRVTESMRMDDPGNSNFARQSRFRLDAEMVRDNALAVSGLLIESVGGRSVRPYQPAGYYAHLNFPRRTYKHDDGEHVWRRTVYTHWQRTFLHPSLKAFDAPTREECTADRPRSNTPLQSLVLLNDPIYVEAARALAGRTITASDNGEQRIHVMFQSVLQREPSGEEVNTLLKLADKHHQQFEKKPKSIDAFLSVGTLPVPEGINRLELATWTSLARVLLNLHESIVRY